VYHRGLYSGTFSDLVRPEDFVFSWPLLFDIPIDGSPYGPLPQASDCASLHPLIFTQYFL